MWIHFSCDVFVVVSCRGILLNSPILTKTWSMQAWIPVVSSSLYFRKSVVSFRVDRVHIKLKISWLRAFLWCMSQTSRDRVNGRHVRTHEKNSGDVVPKLDNHTKHVLCPIRSQYSLDRLEMVQWESVHRGSSARAWKLCSRLSSRPGSPRMSPNWFQKHSNSLFRIGQSC